MAEAAKPPAIVTQGHSKTNNVPRALMATETSQTITAWTVWVRNYMRRDEAFYPFINVKTVWDMSREGETYGLSDEHEESKLKRKKEEMAEDLVSFLEILRNLASVRQGAGPAGPRHCQEHRQHAEAE